MPIEEFYTDLFETALKEDELLLEIQIPTPAPRTGSAYEKFNLLSSDQGIIAVAASITLNGKTCKSARIALGNAAPTAMRAKRAEEMLAGQKLADDLLEKVGQAAAEDCEPIADIHASADYRRHLVSVFTKRMVKKAWQQAEKAA
jgi:CO/xanthine dehydrogenase FAD-binding subunit